MWLFGDLLYGLRGRASRTWRAGQYESEIRRLAREGTTYLVSAQAEASTLLEAADLIKGLSYRPETDLS